MLFLWIAIGVLALLIILWLFLTFPAFRRHKDRKILRGLFIAHRGLHSNENGIPENSLPAFKKALDHGFGIEIDIHITADGQIVVFHDDTLLRLCGVDKKVEDLTLAQIKSLCLGDSAEKIPTLQECLDTINGRVPLLIEFKCSDIIHCKELCTAAEAILSHYNGKYIIQSFYPTVLYWYRKNKKDVCRGQLSSTFKGEAFHKKMLGALLFNFLARPDFVSYEYKYSKYLPLRLNKLLGAFPVGWTYPSPDDVEQTKKAFNTYIFEGFVPTKNNLLQNQSPIKTPNEPTALPKK